MDMPMRKALKQALWKRYPRPTLPLSSEMKSSIAKEWYFRIRLGSRSRDFIPSARTVPGPEAGGLCC